MGNVSTVETPFDAPLEDIVIHALPTGSKTVNIIKAVNIDGNAIFLDDKNRLYSTKVRKGCHFTLGDWGFSASLIKGLIAFGIISKPQGDQWQEANKRSAARTTARSDLNYFDHILKKYSLKIAARERAKLVKAAGVKEAA